MTASPNWLCDRVGEDSQAAAAAAAAAEQWHSNFKQAIPAAASQPPHAAQLLADSIPAQASHTHTSGLDPTGNPAPDMGSGPSQYMANQRHGNVPKAADAEASDAHARPAHPAVFSATMEFAGNEAAASTAHYFRHEVRVATLSAADVWSVLSTGLKDVMLLDQACTDLHIAPVHL